MPSFVTYKRARLSDPSCKAREAFELGCRIIASSPLGMKEEDLMNERDGHPAWRGLCMFMKVVMCEDVATADDQRAIA